MNGRSGNGRYAPAAVVWTAFFILSIDADVSDVRIRERHNLSRIARIGDNFLIARHGRVEHDFGGHAASGAESAPQEDFAVGKHEGCLRTRVGNDQTQGSSLFVLETDTN